MRGRVLKNAGGRQHGGLSEGIESKGQDARTEDGADGRQGGGH